MLLAGLFLLALPASAQDACPIPLIAGPDLIVTDRGIARGVQEDGIWSFKNLPYVAPPVNDLRWQPPQPSKCWGGAIRDARAFGPACPQLDDNGNFTGNEDCLQLNVWSRRSEQLAPVMVWIHGGGHVQGSAIEEQAGVRIYDGSALTARTGMVVVTINYRLGALGYLSHPYLGDATNFGLNDQIAALQWVQRNIRAFGGDPNRVMIAGQSAGGVSVCALIASPVAAGLFQSAVLQSGGCTAIPQARAEAFATTVIGKTGCTTAACLRALTAEQVVTALPIEPNVAGLGAEYGPIVDGVTLSDSPLNIITSGLHNHVPVIVGNTSQETSRAVPIVPSEATYQALVRQLFPLPDIAQAVLRLYPASDYPTPRAAYIAVTSDAKFVCSGATRAAQALLQGQAEPVYRYVFSHALENGGSILKALGAWHGLDVLFLFDKLGAGSYRPTPGERTIAEAMATHWLTLANGSAPWTRYSAPEPYLNFDSPITTGTAYRNTYCDFWYYTSQLPTLLQRVE